MAIDPLEALAAAEAGTEESPPADSEAEAPPAPEQPPGVLETRFGGDVNQLERSYQELEQHLGRQGNEMGKRIASMERELEQFRTPAEPEPEPEYDGQWPDMSYDQFQEWMETDTPGATTYLVNKAVEIEGARIRAEYEKTLNDRLKPVESQVQHEAANTVAAGLKKTFGNDTVKAYEPLIQAEIERHPELMRGDARDVYDNLKRVIATAEWERGRATQQNGGAPTPPVHVEGGSGGRPVGATGEQELTPGEQLFNELTSTRIERDAFGNPKRPA